MITSRQSKRGSQKVLHAQYHTARRDARWKIITLANQFMMRNRHPRYERFWNQDRKRYEMGVVWSQPVLLGMNNLNRAVKIVRHNRLGSPVLLRTAGFNP